MNNSAQFQDKIKVHIPTRIEQIIKLKANVPNYLIYLGKNYFSPNIVF